MASTVVQIDYIRHRIVLQGEIENKIVSLQTGEGKAEEDIIEIIMKMVDKVYVMKVELLNISLPVAEWEETYWNCKMYLKEIK